MSGSQLPQSTSAPVADQVNAEIGPTMQTLEPITLSNMMNFDLLSNFTTHVTTKLESPLPVNMNVPKEPFYYYTCPPNAPEEVRRQLILSLFDFPSRVANVPFVSVGAWALTLIDLVFPGLCQQVINLSKTHRPVPNEFTQEQVVYLLRQPFPVDAVELTRQDGETEDAYQARRIAAADANTARLNNDNCENLTEILVGYTRKPVVANAPAPPVIPWELVVSGVGLLLFGLGKKATAMNMSAFDERRVRAIAGKMGVPENAPSLKPSLISLNLFSGFFSLVPSVREILVKEIISWDYNKSIVTKEIVNTHTKLWKGTGLTHVFLIRQMLINYGNAIMRITPLKAEVLRFMQGLRQLKAMDDLMYYKVIHGDRLDILPAKDVNELLKLARDIQTIENEKLSQFAQGLGQSAYLGQFKVICHSMHLVTPFNKPTAEQVESAEKSEFV